MVIKRDATILEFNDERSEFIYLIRQHKNEFDLITKFKVGEGAGVMSSVPSTVGGAGGLLTVTGAGAGA